MGIANPLTSPAHKIGGLYFNGRNAYVKVPDSESLNITDEITIASWIYPLKVDSYRGIAADTSSGITKLGWRFYVLRGKLEFTHGDGTTGAYYATDAIISTNQWYFVAVTFKDDKGKLFVNEEVKEFTPELSLVSKDDWLGIGRAFLNEYQATYFNGIISSVRIYNRALSQSEIELLYANPDYPLTDGLVLWLPLNQNWGSRVLDKSGYGNHGTIYNAEWAVRR